LNNYAALIVDDDEGIRQLLIKLLTREGYRAEAAATAPEALRLLQANVYDIMISDIRMPEMDGLALVTHVRQIDTQLPIILMTAFATVDTAITALRVGVQDYIMKPFDNHEILGAVKKALLVADPLPASLQAPPAAGGYLSTANAKMQQIVDMVGRVAKSNASVLLSGETGTGKELAARALHDASPRADKPFVKVNCAALPENLLEAELFGYERGAFTGAVSRKPGRFEIADEGSILLDEIGEIPLALQGKLLRVLQEKSFERLGGVKSTSVDVRVIAATNRDLEQMVVAGTFREDLFYRLNVIAIKLPPLRERREDILPLTYEFLRTLQGARPRIAGLSTEVEQALQRHDWPGNIRELHNVIERGVVVSDGEIIQMQDLPEKFHCPGPAVPEENLDSVVDGAEREAILRALEQTGGNRSLAAELLGISRRSLHRKLSRYGL
jgi:two-component system NtrC family response regulator/two-component system response regulator AtoC